MRVSRLFLPVALGEGLAVDLAEEPAHYLKSVLRLRRGDELLVFNGEGGQFSARVELLSRAATRLAIGSFQDHRVESPLRIDLGLGISRGDRMDLAIQKAVELGVSAISPLATERSVVKLEADRRLTRWQHWRRVAQSACEQSGRDILPNLNEPLPLHEWLAAGGGLKILLDPAARRSLRDLEAPRQGVSLLSGPEGGFSHAEREHAQAAGFLSISLGPRVLRAETAALAALTAVQMLWGDLCGPSAEAG
jgi:16S rRNA (uracil1498-N3)-methyltransferase